MSAERLREAAAGLRAQVDAAPEQTAVDARVSGVYVGSRHYLTVTPAVALAFARWLDDESYAPETDHGDGITTGGPRMEALAVANAYLGTPDP